MKLRGIVGPMLLLTVTCSVSLPGILLCRKAPPKTGTRLLEFHESQSVVCQNLVPAVDRARMKYGTWFREFRILEMRSREGREMVIKHRVTKAPTFLILDDEGKEVDRISGEITEDLLEKFIDNNLKKK